MKKIILLLFVFTLQSCQSQTKETMDPKVKKTDAEWKAQLSEVEYEVLRKKVQKELIQVNIGIILKKELIFVQLVNHNFLNQTLNLNQIVVGLLLIKLLKEA